MQFRTIALFGAILALGAGSIYTGFFAAAEEPAVEVQIARQ